MQRIIMGNLIFPLRFRFVRIALVILSTDTPAFRAACPVAGRRGRHVIEFPTANLICTEMKLYGICLERSINCFLCFLGSHKYSSFGSWRDVD